MTILTYGPVDGNVFVKVSAARRLSALKIQKAENRLTRGHFSLKLDAREPPAERQSTWINKRMGGREFGRSFGSTGVVREARYEQKSTDL